MMCLSQQRRRCCLSLLLCLVSLFVGAARAFQFESRFAGASASKHHRAVGGGERRFWFSSSPYPSASRTFPKGAEFAFLQQQQQQQHRLLSTVLRFKGKPEDDDTSVDDDDDDDDDKSQIQKMANFLTLRLGQTVLKEQQKKKKKKKKTQETTTEPKTPQVARALLETRQELEKKRKEHVDAEQPSPLHKKEGDRVVALKDDFSGNFVVEPTTIPKTTSKNETTAVVPPKKDVVSSTSFGRPLEAIQKDLPPLRKPPKPSADKKVVDETKAKAEAATVPPPKETKEAKPEATVKASKVLVPPPPKEATKAKPAAPAESKVLVPPPPKEAKPAAPAESKVLVPPPPKETTKAKPAAPTESKVLVPPPPKEVKPAAAESKVLVPPPPKPAEPKKPDETKAKTSIEKDKSSAGATTSWTPFQTSSTSPPSKTTGSQATTGWTPFQPKAASRSKVSSAGTTSEPAKPKAEAAKPKAEPAKPKAEATEPAKLTAEAAKPKAEAIKPPPAAWKPVTLKTPPTETATKTTSISAPAAPAGNYMDSLGGSQTGPKPGGYSGFGSKPKVPTTTGSDYLSQVSSGASMPPRSYPSTGSIKTAPIKTPKPQEQTKEAPPKTTSISAPASSSSASVAAPGGNYMDSLGGSQTAPKPAGYSGFGSKPKAPATTGSDYLSQVSSGASVPARSYPSSAATAAAAPAKASGDYMSSLSGPQTAPKPASYSGFGSKPSWIAEDLSKAGKAENEWKDWVADDMSKVGKGGTDQHPNWIAEDMKKAGESGTSHMPHVKKQTEKKKTETELQAEDMMQAGKKTGYDWIARDMKEAGKLEDKASTKPLIDKFKDAVTSEREHEYDDVYKDMKKAGREGSFSSDWVAEDMKKPGRAESPSEKMHKDSSYELGKWQKKALDVDEVQKDMKQAGHAESRDWVGHDMEVTGRDETLRGRKNASPNKDLADWLTDENESIAKDLMKEGKAIGGTHSKQKISRGRLGDLVAEDMKATGRTSGSWVEQDMKRAGHPESHLNKETEHIDYKQREIEEVMKTRAATPADYMSNLSGGKPATVKSRWSPGKSQSSSSSVTKSSGSWAGSGWNPAQGSSGDTRAGGLNPAPTQAETSSTESKPFFASQMSSEFNKPESAASPAQTSTSTPADPSSTQPSDTSQSPDNKEPPSSWSGGGWSPQ